MEETSSFKTAIVLGAGAFGTSMACVLANNFQKVILKVRSKDIYHQLKDHKNELYLQGVHLPANLVPALTWSEVKKIAGKSSVEIVVNGIPTSASREFFEKNKKQIEHYLEEGIPFLSLSKGIDPDTLELPDDFFFHHFPDYRDLFTFLSGPSFAREIIQEQITLVSLAGRSRSTMMSVSKMLKTSYFKVFLTYDIKGLLLGGALKNVLAIATGIVEGLGHNYNTRAALITKGIEEMLRFGVVFNARPETFYGLSGMGDLILTTTGHLSRNRQFGLDLVSDKGKTPQEILLHQRKVVEGYKTAKAVFLLAEKYHLRCRIFKGVYSVLYEGISAKDVIDHLMRTIDKTYLVT